MHKMKTEWIISKLPINIFFNSLNHLGTESGTEWMSLNMYFMKTVDSMETNGRGCEQRK